jgi:DNA-binding transcriptional ArsR family regulator
LLKDYAAQWLQSIDVAPKTRACYAESLKTYILPVLGPLIVRKIHRQHIRGLLAKATKRDGTPLSQNSRRLIRATLSVMLGDAVDAGDAGITRISHATLARKLTVSRATAERITQHLRRHGLIHLAKRGGSYGGANYYTIRPLTQDLLDGLKVHSPSPMRGSTPPPVRDHRLSQERLRSRARFRSARSRRREERRRIVRTVPGCDWSEAGPHDRSAR